MNGKFIIAVDAMGGDNSPKKIIQEIEIAHKEDQDIQFKIFGIKPVAIIPIRSDKLRIRSILVVSLWFKFATSLSHSPAHKPWIAKPVPPEIPARGAIFQKSLLE